MDAKVITETARPNARPLVEQLIRSHLLVASIGIGLLVIALAAIILLRGELVRITERQAPLDQATNQLLQGVEASLAALRGWVSLENERFLEEWSSAWSDSIDPAVEVLANLGDPLVDLGGRSQFPRLLPLLEELKESQWWIQNVAHTPGNRSAEVTFHLEVEPVADGLDAIFDSLMRGVSQTPTSQGLGNLMQVASGQRAYARARLLVEKIVFGGVLSHESEYRRQLNEVKTRIRLLKPDTPVSLRRLIALLERETEAFRRLADEAISQRKSDHWNTAQYLMEAETVPIADEVVRSVRFLSASTEALMNTHTHRAKRITTMAAWGMLALIGSMLVAAVVIARRRSHTLSRPISELVKATRTFANGRLTQFVNVSGSAELGKLSQAFNTMQSSLIQSQDELRQANATLEQRVQTRTRDLTRSNRLLLESESRFRATFEQAAVGIAHVSPEGRFLRVNERFLDIIGYVRDDALTLTFQDITHPNDLDTDLDQKRLILAREIQTYAMEKRYRRKDGTLVWVNLTVSLTWDDDRYPDYFISVVEDISARKQAEERLRQAAAVFENTAEGVMITDTNNRILSVNRAFTEITGYQEAEIEGRAPSLLQSDHQDLTFYQHILNEIEVKGRWQGEILNRRKNGENFPAWLTISVVKNAQGRVQNYVGVFADITTIKRSQAKLVHLAHHDPLTGLPNRSLFNDRLAHALDHTRRGGHRLAVLFLDLDRFKNVNDSLGHPVGDQLLKDAAQRLTACVRHEDTVARLGGDEFAVTLETIEHERNAARVAGKIIRALAEPFKLMGHNTFITASIGIAIYPEDGVDVTSLVKNADAAMYVAKEDGRNGYRFYRSEMTHKALYRLTLEASLRRALEREEFVVWYQPQMDLLTGRMTGAEALVRWHDPKRGLIQPADFIPLAEETGLVIPLGDWVLRTVCAQGKAWLDAGLRIEKLAVNVAGPQIEQRDFLIRVSKILENTGLPPRVLELEITESFIMRKAEYVLKALQGLRKLGVSAAIDDFGTGYSSLSHLKRLPIDKLKIDRGFVRDLPNDVDDAAITRAVIALGHSLGFTVIAEGVENDAQQLFLRQEGCGQMQGYLYAPPLPADEFAHSIKGGRPITGDSLVP